MDSPSAPQPVGTPPQAPAIPGAPVMAPSQSASMPQDLSGVSPQNPLDVSNLTNEQVAELANRNGFNLGKALKGAGARFAGAVEAIAPMAAGIVTEPLAGIAGLTLAPLPGVEGGDVVKTVQKALSYQPRTESGRQTQQAMGETLKPIQEAVRGAGEFTQDVTGSALAATAVETAPTALMEYFGARGLGGLKTAAKQRAEVVDATAESKFRTIPDEKKFKSRFAQAKAAGEDVPATFEDTGIRASRGEAMQAEGVDKSFDQLKEEQALLEQSGPAGDQMRAFKAEQSAEIQQYLDGLSPGDAAIIGPTVKEAIELRESSLKHKRNEAYSELGRIADDIDVKLSHTPVVDALPDPGDMADFSAINPGQARAIDNALAEFGIDKSLEAKAHLDRHGIEVRPWSVKTNEALRKRINNIIDSDQTGNTARVLGPIKKAIDAEFESAAKALEAGGVEDVARAAKQARLANREFKVEMDDAGMVKQLIDTKGKQNNIPKIEDSNVYAKLVAKSTPIEQFKNVVSSLGRAASKGKTAIGQIKSRMILDLVDSGFGAKSRKIKGENVFGANAFASRFDDMKPKLEAIFTKAEMQKLNDLRKNAKDLTPPAGTTPKGSAGFFIDALEKMGVWKLTGKSAMLDALAGQIRRSAQVSRGERIAREATTADKQRTKLLGNDYPALVNALVVGKVAPKAPKEEERKFPSMQAL